MPLNPYESSAVPALTRCKICDGYAKIVGVVDFSRCGADVLAGRKVDDYGGWPIYYHRCENCHFTFTRAMDQWTTADFAKHVYNDDYVRHDPDCLGARPQANADLIAQNFGRSKDVTILDYGSGLGLLEKNLNQHGFQSTQSYDPFSAAARPTGTFKMVTSYEVFEHVVDPVWLINDLKSFLDDDGAVLFSTQICTQDIIDQGLSNWWYCAPRNGHISFYSQQSLGVLAQRCGLQCKSFNESLHVLHRETPPEWLAPFVGG